MRIRVEGSVYPKSVAYSSHGHYGWLRQRSIVKLGPLTPFHVFETNHYGFNATTGTVGLSGEFHATDTPYSSDELCP